MVLGLLLGAAGPVAAAGGRGAVLWETNQPVIVDRADPAASAVVFNAHPVPQSVTPRRDAQVLGNTALDVQVPATCGYRTATVEVFCFDRLFELSQAEQRDVLAFSAVPVRVTVDNGRAEHAIKRVYALRGDRFANAEFVVQADPACQGACERRVTLEIK